MFFKFFSFNGYITAIQTIYILNSFSCQERNSLIKLHLKIFCYIVPLKKACSTFYSWNNIISSE